jgi:hypothetical protein
MIKIVRSKLCQPIKNEKDFYKKFLNSDAPFIEYTTHPHFDCIKYRHTPSILIFFLHIYGAKCEIVKNELTIKIVKRLPQPKVKGKWFNLITLIKKFFFINEN